MDYFCDLCAGSYDWSSLTRNVKLAFSLLLLNGGGEIVQKIFEHHVKELEPLMKIEDMPKLKEGAIQKFKDFSAKLGKPWFAIDECHVPTIEFTEVLFHSNYDINLKSGVEPETIFQWQRYEQFPHDF